MKQVLDEALDNAAAAFAVANTPLFFLRKLRSDPAILEMGRSVDSAELRSGLRAATTKDPTTILDAVRPFVYLVAISLSGNVAALEEAAAISAPSYDWYRYIAKVLQKIDTPTMRRSIEYNDVRSPVVVAKSTGTTTQTTLRVGSG